MKKAALSVVVTLLLPVAILGIGGSGYISRSAPRLDDAQKAFIAAADALWHGVISASPMDGRSRRIVRRHRSHA